RTLVGPARIRYWSFPYFPGRASLLPQVLQETLIAQRIHALPEAFVLIRGKLALGCQPLQRVSFETAVIVLEVIKYRRLEDHETAIDPAFADLWFFRKINHHAVAVKDQTAKARGRTYCR